MSRFAPRTIFASGFVLSLALAFAAPSAFAQGGAQPARKPALRPLKDAGARILPISTRGGASHQRLTLSLASPLLPAGKHHHHRGRQPEP